MEEKVRKMVGKTVVNVVCENLDDEEPCVKIEFSDGLVIEIGMISDDNDFYATIIKEGKGDE